MGIQIVGVLAVLAFVAAATAVIMKVIDVTMGLRPTSRDETTGLDLADHREVAYS